GDDGFPASPDPYAFCHDSAAAHPFGMPDSNGNGMHHEAPVLAGRRCCIEALAGLQ
uniref:Uncharacterized protein n=1 Tax=Aegilops tauschii subsp. strangulata TaxID=200361 RepID=A0A453SK77_AEGTS